MLYLSRTSTEYKGSIGHTTLVTLVVVCSSGMVATTISVNRQQLLNPADKPKQAKLVHWIKLPTVSPMPFITLLRFLNDYNAIKVRAGFVTW